MNAKTKLMWAWGVWSVLTVVSGRGLCQEPVATQADTKSPAVAGLSDDPLVAEAADRPLAPESITTEQDGVEEKKAAPKQSAAREPRTTAAPGRSAPRSTPVRLPAYFGSLVDSRQRAAIYEIREAMSVQIAALEMQLEELRQAEMREIEAILTDEQLQRLEMLRAARSGQAIPQKTEPSGT